jgi:hypothetical protein
MDIAAWLRGLGLEQYAQLFRDNDIDGEILCGMTAEDLKELGISSFGHRRRLLNAITALAGEPPTRDVAESATSATSAPTSPPRIDAERRQLTVMFCDLVGSTALAARLDPEDLRDVIAAYHRAIAEVIARFDGFVARYMGDGVLAYFGYPQAREDDGKRAVRAGLTAVEAVRELPISEPLRVRIGLATGQAAAIRFAHALVVLLAWLFLFDMLFNPFSFLISPLCLLQWSGHRLLAFAVRVQLDGDIAAL